MFFQYKGQRRYISGSDIYYKMLETVNNLWELYPISISGFFHELLTNSAIIQIYEHDQIKFNKYIALFLIQVNKKLYDIFILDSGIPVTESYQYDEQVVLRDSEISDNKISMIYNNTFSYIDQIVAMNIKNHQNCFGDFDCCWLFTKIKINNIIDPKLFYNKKITICLEKNFNAIFTESLINIDNENIGSIFFSRNTTKEKT
jgi:hypothetical protein